MQAGDKLEFVEKFTPDDTPEISGREALVVDEMFLKTCLDTLKAHRETLNTTERLEVSGFVTVFEKAFAVHAGDGSYLHISIFGHEDDKGPLDYNVSVIEHDPDHRLIGGYLYALTHQGLTRTTMAPGPGDEDLPHTIDPHFSVLQSYAGIDEMSDMELAGDDEQRDMAQALKQELEEMASIELWSRELGYEGQHPSMKEVRHLTRLIAAAEPFEYTHEA